MTLMSYYQNKELGDKQA